MQYLLDYFVVLVICCVATINTCFLSVLFVYLYSTLDMRCLVSSLSYHSRHLAYAVMHDLFLLHHSLHSQEISSGSNVLVDDFISLFLFLLLVFHNKSSVAVK